MAIVDTLGDIQSSSSVWAARIRSWFERYAERRCKRRAVAHLRAVNPRTLKDIGIDRSEASSIIYGGRRGRRRFYQCF